MNFILILILITIACIAIRKTLNERKAEQKTQQTERQEAFRHMVRELYRR
jgi:hypothetical protein